MKKSLNKKKSITVYSEGVCHQGVRSKHAFSWTPCTDVVAEVNDKQRQVNRVAAARSKALSVIAAQNLSKEEKRKLRHAVSEMDDADILAFAAKLVAYG